MPTARYAIVLGLVVAVAAAVPAAAAPVNDAKTGATPLEIPTSALDGVPVVRVVAADTGSAAFAGATIAPIEDSLLQDFGPLVDHRRRCRDAAADGYGLWSVWYRLTGVAGAPLPGQLALDLSFRLGAADGSGSQHPSALMVLEAGTVIACDASGPDGGPAETWVRLRPRPGRDYLIALVGRASATFPATLSVAATDIEAPAFAISPRDSLEPGTVGSFLITGLTDAGSGPARAVRWSWRLGSGRWVRPATTARRLRVRWPHAGAAVVTASIADLAGNVRVVTWRGSIRDRTPPLATATASPAAGRFIRVAVTCSEPSRVTVTARDGATARRLSGAASGGRVRSFGVDLAVGPRLGVWIVDARCADSARNVGHATAVTAV